MLWYDIDKGGGLNEEVIYILTSSIINSMFF